MVSICILKGSLLKVKVIEAVINDDSDYDYITDSAMHNTLADFFKWSKEAGVKISFEKEFDNSDYSLKLIVWAILDNKEDYGYFKLMFDGAPFNKLDIKSDFEGRFIRA
jgi:hypothetical protein